MNKYFITFLAIALFGFATSVHAISYVQNAHVRHPATLVTSTLPSVTVGDLLIVVIRGGATTDTFSVSDSLNGQWNAANSGPITTSTGSVAVANQLWYFPNTAGSGSTVTFTVSSTQAASAA